MALIQSFAKLSLQTPKTAVCRTYVAARNLNPRKFRSILAEVPIRPRSGWQVFMCEHIGQYKTDDGRLDPQRGTHVLSDKWEKFSDAEKQQWQDKYKAGVAAHTEALKKALENATPQQFHDENVLRKKYKLPLLKDPKAPKRPLNSFLLFMSHLRETRPDEFTKLSQLEQAIYAGKHFKALTAEQRKPFEDKATELKDQYHKEMEHYKSNIRQAAPEKPKRTTSRKDSTKKKSSKAKSAEK
ncbi:hypothetical protein EC973_005962 [Apophysomyces ossiformis]|uniref:HMG box domain-containing protein n=1 Tax=Apophysomyces ossiformis TaxID=679940 RepID=A0A8H7BWS5_9FUNG|nr:hypothetical protein EC973_005962 [Apophysomyces ossiformis]